MRVVQTAACEVCGINQAAIEEREFAGAVLVSHVCAECDPAVRAWCLRVLRERADLKAAGPVRGTN